MLSKTLIMDKNMIITIRNANKFKTNPINNKIWLKKLVNSQIYLIMSLKILKRQTLLIQGGSLQPAK